MCPTKTSTRLQDCIDECLQCQSVCLEELMNHCLEMGGDHLQPDHVRLMMNCADICQASARFMMTNSRLHHLTCDVCAQVCEECARSCEAIGEMQRCVDACRSCSESCRRMAA